MMAKREKSMRPADKAQKRKHWYQWFKVGRVTLIVVLVIGALIVVFSQEWTKLTESRTVSVETIDSQGVKTTTQVNYRTLWDLCQLIFVPALLAFVAWGLTELGRKNEMEIANRRIQEEILQSYLDKMTELIFDKALLKSGDDETRAVARTRTLTALQRLDGKRKGLVVRFLYESALINAKDHSPHSGIIELSGADLTHVDLSGANLIEVCLARTDLRDANLSGACLLGADLLLANLERADLCGADLIGADVRTNLAKANLSGAGLTRARLTNACLIGTNLSKAVLNEAYMTGADLRGANLTGAYMKEADLISADLKGATLRKADLTKARVTQRELAGTKSLKGAIMQDGTRHD